MNYISKLTQSVKKKNSYLCVGIDPDPHKLPEKFEKNVEGVFNFCREIIAATKEFTPAYKFNLAFFEIWGWQGWKILEELIALVPDDILLVGDAKRGDIGNSSQFYAKALTERLKFDSITLSPYLGSESILPFIEDENKGCFVLCVTSNPSGRELQDHGGNYPLYLRTAEICASLNQKGNVGMVMGATKPEQLIEVRQQFPTLPFLIPGVGTQGGEIQTAVDVCQKNGAGLINVSRGILFPEGQNFPENVIAAAKKYQQLFKIEG
ncbi:MAG: orotidine-5'-phosphate decarboxylase [Candidatus Marinimicrobia bacterium]|nr:orotidine-5'-phosphate decarboxylase [Candidatus Neomarinimicrobiota bacterium]